jgi:ABC-type molybdate transport system permease subunit
VPAPIALLLSLFFSLSGAMIILRAIEFTMNPIAHLHLAPLMLFPAGGLFLLLGYYLTRKFGKR